MEVFISWTGTDRDVKNAIVESLHAENIECWDSDEYCTSDYSPECIAAIKRCEVFIVIVSDDSMKKGYVFNEVIAARNMENEGKLNILVYKVTDAPYTDAFEFQLNHISFVSGNLIKRQENAVGNSGIDMIVKRTKRLLMQRKNGEAEKPFDVFKPQIDGMEIARTGYFVENSRDDILASMEAAFEKSNIVILNEIFGFGKRSTVRKYIEMHKDDYDTKVMINNSNNNLREFLMYGLEFANVNKKLFESLEGDALIKEKFRFLEKMDERTILVITDVRLENCPDAVVCEKLSALKCRIVLITQESADSYRDWFPVINLGRMRDEHLLELFFHHYEHAYDDEKEDLEEPLKQFFGYIGGHTKTVELTASVLARDMGIYPEDIPKYLTMSGYEGIQLKDRILNQLSQLFDMEKLSEQERKALLVAAYIAIPSVSEKGYRNALDRCGVEDWQIILKLDRRGWIDVDMRNRSVVVEPLIAQIVISKFPEDYEVITRCFEYLIDNAIKIIGIGSSEIIAINGYGKAEYLLSVTGMPEEAEIFGCLKQYTLNSEEFDTKTLTDAISRYEEKSWEIEDEEETEEDICDKAFYQEIVREFMEGGLLSSAKLISKDMIGVVMNFNFASTIQGQEKDFLNMESLVGVSKDEMQEVLEVFREEIQMDEDFDEEDSVTMIFLEVIAAYEALYNKDYAGLMLCLNSMTTVMDNTPDALEDEELANLFYNLSNLICTMFIKSGAVQNAVQFCEKILRYKSNSSDKMLLFGGYLKALRYCQSYTDEMYRMYETLLGNFEKIYAESFANRLEMMKAKRQWQLSYVIDLANGQRIDDAIKEYLVTEKLSRSELPDETIETIKCLTDAMINSGQFEKAMEFLKDHLTEREIDFFKETGSEETRQTIEYLESLKEMYKNQKERENQEDPEKYVSYYQAFSRKNNSLLEQKYCNVAEKAVKIDFSNLEDEEIAEYALELKKRAKREKMISMAPEVFALASEAGFRTLGYRHHYVQYMGAAAMAEGKIAEILNGEGKTYTIVLTAFLNYVYGKKVFVVDSSPYLTKRNYEWMHGVYALLGMTCDYISQSGQITTKCSKKQEDVTYISILNLMMGYLDSEIRMDYHPSSIQYDCAIIDEIDSVLVDEAKMPYALVTEKTQRNVLSFYRIAYQLAKEVEYDESYYCYHNGNVEFHSAMYQLIEDRYGISYTDVRMLETIKEIESIVSIAIRCLNHYEEGTDYHIIKGTPVQENREKGIFEEFSLAYKYFLCRMHGLNTEYVEMNLMKKKQTRNMICVRDFFKKFKTVCGTTATAVSLQKEFKEIYNLDYIAVPPFKPCIRKDRQSPVYMNIRAKDKGIIDMVIEKHRNHQPVLLIAQSVKESEKYSRLLTRAGIEHQLLNAKNTDESSDIIASAGETDSVLITTFFVNRGTDIKLGGDPESKTRRELVHMGVDVTGLNGLIYSIATPEQKKTQLYQKYYSILEKNKLLAENDRKRVVEAGGLCVIGTSFFAEPRTEQQVRGRSGRQGEVGESYVFRSFEDDILDRFLSEQMLERIQMLMQGENELDSRMLHKALENAQKRIHTANYKSIRDVVNVSWYIDKARKDIIVRKGELAENEISPEDIMLEWVEDKETMKKLEMLQRGAENVESKLLRKLFEKYPEVLKKAKGRKAEKILTELLFSEVTKDGRIKMNSIKEMLQVQMIIAWQEYIALVEKTVGKTSMSQQAQERYLESEKMRIYRKNFENVCCMLIACKPKY